MRAISTARFSPLSLAQTGAQEFVDVHARYWPIGAAQLAPGAAEDVNGVPRRLFSFASTPSTRASTVRTVA
jgi:hypothetical protein